MLVPVYKYVSRLRKEHTSQNYGASGSETAFDSDQKRPLTATSKVLLTDRRYKPNSVELFPDIVNKQNNKRLLDLEDFYLKSYNNFICFV